MTHNPLAVPSKFAEIETGAQRCCRTVEVDNESILLHWKYLRSRQRSDSLHLKQRYLYWPLKVR
jgi:hypothetical protein